jgi:hypothetical protein
MKLFLKLLGAIFFITLSNYSAANEPSIEQTILSVHNELRAMHHVPALEWDETLANYARHYADKCQFRHSSSPYGENLAAGYPTVNDAINAWYSEHEHYSYKWPGFSYKTGHFSQMIWKSSKKLGCAFVLCDGKNGTPGHYLVCEYSPHGNITNKGYFEENVLPKT